MTTTPAELRETFDRQFAASRAEPPATWQTRRDRLRRLRALVMTHRAAIAAAINEDFGNRAAGETDLLEMVPTLGAFRHALAHGERWMRARRRPTTIWFRPGRSRVMPQPLGVAGIISPWNYPLLLTVGPLTSAIAAGNRAMVKLSEFSPRFGELFARLVADAFDPAELAVVNGAADIGGAFSALPFDRLLFTGSTAVGHHIMRAAADNLTPVTLELGGKSPAIIAADADFDRAVTRIMAGKLYNAGQTCIAPDYVLLPNDRITEFIDKARATTLRFYPARTRERDYTTIISDRQYARLAGLLDEARAAGATVTPLADGDGDPARRLMMPAALTGVPDTAAIMREEIFGPLLPLVGCDTIEAAIAYVRARPRPLALYLFSRDEACVKKVMAETVSGGVTINDTLLHIAQDGLPFGGVGPSGMGVYHGEDGFREFSHMKPVFTQSRVNGLGLFAPPYGRRFAMLVKMLLR